MVPSPLEIVEVLIRGQVVLHKLTVPEGYNIKQVAQLVGQTGLVQEEAFLRAAQSQELAEILGISAETLEGYLFPETYYFPATTTAQKIISAMVQRFGVVFDQEYQARAKELGFTTHQIVTLASIVEKETGAAHERPLIASVFHNRLKKRMRLESDPTVIYGIKDFDGNITRRHLKTKTPYNTYRRRGLPLGPIASPGQKAIEAVLYPASSAFLYFVSKKDGTHQFSTNLRDHNSAVRKYQLRR